MVKRSKRSNYTKDAGIYKLTCVDNGKIYIGKAVNIQKRLCRHKNNSTKAKGSNYFQNATIKYGWDSFTVEILEIVKNFDKQKDNKPLLERESYYIELYDTTDKTKGYNLCKYSNDRTGMIGFIHSEESKEKMRQKALARTYSEEEKDRLRTINIGRKLSQEHKDKIKFGNTGKFISDETRKKLSESSKGKPKSKEAIEKTRQANLGSKRSEEIKERMSQAQRNRHILKG